VQVRRPVDLVFSLYYQNIRNATENAPDFETAWRWQADRLHGKRLPRARRHNPALSQYKDIGMLGAQLQRVLGIFPRDQVHVIVYDDLSSHAEKVYSDLLEFLGLQHDGRAAFETVNARRAIRSPAFQRCLINLSYLNPVATAIHVAHKVFGAERFNLLGNIERFNLGRWRTPPRLSEPFEEELVEHFREDVLLLSDLIQHDLSHWNEVSSSTHREKGTHFQRGSEASQAIV